MSTNRSVNTIARLAEEGGRKDDRGIDTKRNEHAHLANRRAQRSTLATNRSGRRRGGPSGASRESQLQNCHNGIIGSRASTPPGGADLFFLGAEDA
jgi:hypothetical protein